MDQMGWDGMSGHDMSHEGVLYLEVFSHFSYVYVYFFIPISILIIRHISSPCFIISGGGSSIHELPAMEE